MALNFPTAHQLRGDLDSLLQTSFKDSTWDVRLKDDSNVDPADVHGA